jgi:DnaJ-class molecular chaperone
MYHVVWVVGLLGLIAFSSGCSEPHNKGSQIFNPDTGRHISDWVNPAVHGGSAKSQPDGFSTCEECHGSDFTGGISSVACSSCHGGSAPHPTSWMTGTYTHTNTNAGNLRALPYQRR